MPEYLTEADFEWADDKTPERTLSIPSEKPTDEYAWARKTKEVDSGKFMTEADFEWAPEKIDKEPGRTVGGTLKDIAITGAKGVVGLGEAAVGLADIPTFGRVGLGMERYLGYEPRKTKEFLGEFYSPVQKEAFREVEKAKGFVDTIKASVKHPSVIGHAVVETFPHMLGGASAARGLLAIGLKSPLLAGAIGEGIIGAGMAAEETRQQTKDGLLTPMQSGMAALSGAGTALFATVGGRVAQKFGIIDPDTFLASGSNVTSKGIIKRIIGGGISEGAFEELPQSMQEQVWLNAALDKPLMEGVGEAGATGLLTGMAMGTGFNVFTGKQRTPEDIKHPTETAATQQAAANVHDIINEGMTEGNVMGEPFTPDTAFEIINIAYTDKIITNEDIDLFKEQYPELSQGLNKIIGAKVAEEIKVEPVSAAREALLREDERDMTAKELLTGEREIKPVAEPIEVVEPVIKPPEVVEPVVEEKPKEPKIEKPKVAEKEPHEMTVKELAAKEADWFKGKQYLIPRDKFKKIGIERNFIKKDGDYYYILANGEIGNKVEKEIYDQRIKEGIESHKYYIEKAISEGKPVPKEVLAEYPDLAPAKPKEVIKLKPSEILKPDIEAKYGKFLEKVGKRLKSEAIGQDILDSLEATKISPTKVSKTFWEDTFFKLPEGAQNNIKKYLTSLTGMKPGDVMATLKGKDIKAKDWMDIADVVEKDLTKIEHLEGTERGYIALMAYANEQVKTIPAKPITPKPPKPTAPEAIEKEIKAEPIPEVAPKPPVKPKKEPKIEAPIEKVPTKPEPGKAWIKGKQKPILSAREITRGKNKGKYEIVLTRGRDAEGNIIPGVKRVVEKKAIITMPKEIKPYEKPTKKELEVKEAIPAAEGRAVYTDKKIKTEFPEVVSDRAGSYKSGVKTIVAPQDAAAFAHLNLSKYPQEHLASVILDKDRKIISVHRYSIGAPGQAPFSPSLIAGHALNTPDAANLIIVHNHPSGDPMLSIADVGAFDGIKNTLKGTSIKANDIIAVGESEYSSYAEGQTRTKIPDVRAKYEIPMVERVFKQRGKNLYKVSDEDSAVKFGKDHLPEGGLIFLNPKNNAVGVLPIDDYSRLREGTSEIILKQVDATNAVNIIAYEPDTSIPESEKTNLQEFANATDLHLLDIIDDQGSWQAAGVMPTTKGTKFFATKATKPQDTITRQDLQSIFGKMKNVRTGVNAKGNFYFGVEGKPAVEILEVDHIKGFIQVQKGTDKERIPVGSYLRDTIELKTGSKGFTADINTAFHEYMHFLEKNGMLTANDIKALDSAIGKAEVTEEDRATYVGDNLSDWKTQTNTRIKRILKKISDFANAIYEFFSRTRTAKGVLRDIETGKILAEKKEALAGINQFAQDVSFSIKEATKKITDNPNFVKWFGDSKVVDEKGEPLTVYHETIADIHIFDIETSDFGSHFGTKKQVATLSGGIIGERIYPAYLNVKNPIRLIDKGHFEPSSYLDQLAEQGILSRAEIENLSEEDFIFETVNKINKEVRTLLLKKGYDGVVYLNRREGLKKVDKPADDKYLTAPDSVFLKAFPEAQDSYIAFKSTQIKSIYNTGAFGITEPDIRYQMAGQKAVEEAKVFQTKPKRDYRELIKRYQKEAVEKYPEKAGQPTFGETLEPITAEDYVANRRVKRDIKASTVTGIKRVKSEIAEGVDKFFGSISTRLGNVSPKLKAKLRRLDFDTNTKHAEDVKKVEPLLRKARKMKLNDIIDWDYARKNSDIVKIYELVNRYNMREEYIAYRKALNTIRKEGLDVGLEIGEIEEYAPRILKDSRGFLKAIGKAEEWPIYSRKLQERAYDMGISVSEMPHDMKADIISSMILGNWSGLGGTAATKQRKLKKIPAHLNQYYMDSDAALMQHLYSMRKLIEARKFFGKIPQKVAEMRTRLYNAQSKIRDINKQLLDQEITKEESEKLKKRLQKYIGLEKEYTAYIAKYALQRDYTENIATYVIELIDKKEIKPEQERVVNEILNARFHEKGTRGLIQAYKNISYIDTMGSPISALTQIGDMAWPMFEYGIPATLKHAYRAAIKKSRITKEDVGVERIAQEFADSGTIGNAVSKVFKWVQLERMDTIGKETLLNAALEDYQKQAKENPLKLKRKIRSIFEGETDSVIEDLVNDEISENVKLLTYSKLLDFQPVGLSEMPQKYLDAGNGRLFYMLKTFTLKQFDIFRRISYNKIIKGDRTEKIQGMKNLVKMAMFFVLANAGADELKDIFLRRPTDLQDRVVDNMLRLFGVSKFVTWKARTEGVGSALIRQILFPVKFIDSLGKDVITAGDEKGLEMVRSVPVFGKLIYWHLGRGRSKREDLWNRRLRKRKAKLNEINDKLEKAKDKRAFRFKHIKELRELEQVNALQGKLNQKRKRINHLKSLKETTFRKKEIQRLEVERTNMIKEFLNKKK